MYIYNSLIAPLPDDYEKFKRDLVSNNKTFYDTKHLADMFPDKWNTFNKGTTLGSLYDYFTMS